MRGPFVIVFLWECLANGPLVRAGLFILETWTLMDVNAKHQAPGHVTCPSMPINSDWQRTTTVYGLHVPVVSCFILGLCSGQPEVIFTVQNVTNIGVLFEQIKDKPHSRGITGYTMKMA